MQGEKLTKVKYDLAEVVWMSRHVKEPPVTDVALVVRLPEPVLVHITDSLHDEPDGEEDDAGDIPAGAKVVLRIARDGGGVEDRDGQGDGPHPEHLKDPEAQEGEELVALVVEAVILARLEDAEEEEPG